MKLHYLFFQTAPSCEFFNYRLDNGSCQLLKEEAESKPWVNDENVIHGPRICPTGDPKSSWNNHYIPKLNHHRLFRIPNKVFWCYISARKKRHIGGWARRVHGQISAAYLFQRYKILIDYLKQDLCYQQLNCVGADYNYEG